MSSREVVEGETWLAFNGRRCSAVKEGIRLKSLKERASVSGIGRRMYRIYDEWLRH